MSFQKEHDLIRKEMMSVWDKNSKYIAKLEKRALKAEGERDDLKLEVKELAAKVSDISNELYAKNMTIEELNTKLNTASNTTTSSSREFNSLNIKLNAIRKENELLQRQLEELKLNKKSFIKPEPQNTQNILSLLQNLPKTRNQTFRHTQPFPLKVENEKENIIFESSQASSGRAIDSTQSNEDQTMIEEEASYEEASMDDSKNKFETFDITHSKPIIEESIQLKSKSFDIPTSSPDYHSTHENEEEDSDYPNSSPIKAKQNGTLTDIKKQQHSSQISMIEDSQSPEDNFLFNGSIPTPQTSSKRFQTPKLPIDAKPKTQLETPIESDTPMKKRKTKQNSLQYKPGQIVDLTYHPLEKRNWAIEDFKVNLSKNQNVSYAYHVVVRGKERSCIHGKTCQDCEKFYNMAGPLPDFTHGPQWNTETSNKKFNIVSETSRHKDLWERPESPPGFGDFDFPATQEQKELNRKSDLLIRRTAYERLYSALNDQKYIFRDEALNKLVQTNDYMVNENIFFEYLRKE